MKCLETRTRSDGIKRRTYILESGRKVVTYEVPPQVISELGKRKLAAAMDKARRVEERNSRQDNIAARIREGVKPTAIAHEFGVTDQRVRQIRKAMKEGKAA